MKLLESISVRLFDSQNGRLVQELFSQMCNDAAGPQKPSGASLLQNCAVPVDWSMQLTWRGSLLPMAKTALGRQVADSFRSLGMVHHTIWQAFPAAPAGPVQPQAEGKKNDH